MVILGRIRASTLMETLVATVLIVIIFMISSMLLNNMFSNGISARDQDVLEKLHQLKYEYHNSRYELPYYEEVGHWEIVVSRDSEKNVNTIVYKAENVLTHKIIMQRSLDEK